jgi:hypothetical protein
MSTSGAQRGKTKREEMAVDRRGGGGGGSCCLMREAAALPPPPRLQFRAVGRRFFLNMTVIFKEWRINGYVIIKI